MLNNTALSTGSTAIAAQATHLSLHTTGAVTSSTSESTAARVAANWSVSAGGNLTLPSARNFTGGAASGPVVRVGYWSAATGGTYLGGALLQGDASFNAAGEYSITSIAENVTSS